MTQGFTELHSNRWASRQARPGLKRRADSSLAEKPSIGYEALSKRSSSVPPQARMPRNSEALRDSSNVTSRDDITTRSNFLPGSTTSPAPEPKSLDRPNLCSRCSSFSIDDMLTKEGTNAIENRHRDSLGYRIHESFVDLVDFMLQGCQLCRVLIIEIAYYFNTISTNRHISSARQFPEYFTKLDSVTLNYEAYRPIYIRIPQSRHERERHTFEMITWSSARSISNVIGYLEIEAPDGGKRIFALHRSLKILFRFPS